MTLNPLTNNHWLSSRSTIRVPLEDDGITGNSIGDAIRYKLFACPYLKHDSLEYADSQICSKTGWTTIDGLRQHVYRCHIFPIQCRGCLQTFESSRMFARHSHAESHCDRSLTETDEPIKGLESISQKIRSPAYTADNPSEEEMWKVIYTALFPNHPKDQIPYPYFGTEREISNTDSAHESATSLHGEHPTSFLRTPEPAYLGSRCISADSTTASSSVSIASDHAVRNFSRPTSITGGRSHDSSNERAHENTSRSRLAQVIASTDNDDDERHPADSIDEASHMHQATQPVQAHQQTHLSDRRKLKKKLRRKTLEAQVLAFRAWEKPHRTDEHITPGVYRGFWKWLARCFTFYIPSWFLKNYLKMDDIRQRLAFRQKVLFCLLLASIYTLICYFLIIQPIVSCVMKVHIGMFRNESAFCGMVRDLIYVYMGLGGGFMLLVAFCIVRVRYTDRSFEEHDALLVMQIPCYNEDELTLRKTIESCVQSSYLRKRKLLFMVADGTVGAPDQKPTYKILLEDIFDHAADLEAGIDNHAHSYTSFDLNGSSKNQAFCCTGHYRGVPYVIVVKVGRDDEQDNPKPGNRGKRDSQLLAYNFFHYVNYRRFWNPLFENLEFKMRTCLNMDARDAMYMLAIDCDTVVDQRGISYLVDRLQKKPKLIGVCGYTGVSNHMSSFVASSQVFEYWLTHAVLKAVESICSSVFVLSGCFTIYRLKWPNNRPAILHPLLLEDYSGSYDKTLHEHNLLSIGEDRYLSTLAIRYFGSDCRLQYFSAATCTTNVPDTLSVLLDQRRRWTNSLIHCHFAHLNVPPFEVSFFTHVRLLFVLFCELFMVFILPLALPAGVALAVISVLLTPYAWAILLAFLLLPLLLCILCIDWTYIPFYLPFFPMIAVFSIIIPIFSIWNQDNIKWGKTRGE